VGILKEFKNVREVFSDLKAYGHVSISVDELSNLDRKDIDKLNKMIVYDKIRAYVSFDFEDVRIEGVEVFYIEKTRSNKIRLHLWLHENWEEAEWLVKRLKEVGMKAKLDTESDKAVVILEPPGYKHIDIEVNDVKIPEV